MTVRGFDGCKIYLIQGKMGISIFKNGRFFYLDWLRKYSTNEGSNSLFFKMVNSFFIRPPLNSNELRRSGRREKITLPKANQRPATAASLLRAKSRRRNPGKSTATSKSSDGAIGLARPHRLVAAAVIHFRPKRRDSNPPWQTEQEK